MIGRRDLLRALLVIPVNPWRRFWGSNAFGEAVRADASVHYREAFGWLEKLSKSERTLIQGWKSAPSNIAVKRLIRRASTGLSALHRGATSPVCAWDEVVDLHSLGRGHLDACNLQIARMALLRARVLVESGRAREALDDIFAVASFGRHLGRAGLLIARIFQLSLENEAIAALAASLTRLNASTLASIPDRFETLPPSIDWGESMRLEARFIVSTVVTKVEAAGSSIDETNLTEAGVSADEASTILEATGGDPSRVRNLVEEVVPCLEGLAEVLRLPYLDFGPALVHFKSRVEGINPFARSVVEHAERLKYALERTEVLWKMVLAAQTWIVDGPERFRSIADPFGAGPFGFQATSEGFEIRSDLTIEGNLPAILVVK